MSPNATNSENELSERQVLAIPHLVSAKSVSETAELVGVNRRTVYRWMDDPTFREEYDRQRDAVAGSLPPAASDCRQNQIYQARWLTALSLKSILARRS